MDIPYDLFQSRKACDGSKAVLDLDGRVILSDAIAQFDWGRGSTLEDRRRLALTLLFHAGIGDTGPAAEALATAVILGFPRWGWSISSVQLHAWYADYITRGGYHGKNVHGQAGRRGSGDQSP